MVSPHPGRNHHLPLGGIGRKNFSSMKRLIQSVIRQCGLGDVAITVPAGINRRMRWTLFPWTSYWRGTHEPPVQQLIRQLPDLAGSCCWDLGAHYGFYSIALARLVGPSGQVVAFEP